MNYGRILPLLRAVNNLSVTQLAEKMGYSPTLLSRIETGTRVATPMFIDALCETLPIEREILDTLADLPKATKKKKDEAALFIFTRVTDSV